MRDKLLGRKSRYSWGKNSKKEWRAKEKREMNRAIATEKKNFNIN